MTHRINVSSVQDFMNCRFRWWAKWVMNRSPIAESPALDAGKLLHRIFERHFIDGTELALAAIDECLAYDELIPSAHPAAQVGATKALQQIRDLNGAWPLWEDKFVADEVLEVEQAFEYPDPVMENVIWLGRPDRVIRIGKNKYHVQNRGLASSVNFGMYVRLQMRSYHEHLYAEARGLQGTIFNLVRKLKFRTYVGTLREHLKTADEMFWQGPLSIKLKSPLHQSVMMSLRSHVREMIRVRQDWEEFGIVPAPNEKLNGGFGGNSEDPYFRVLIGEVKLEDDNVFKPREDTYADTRNE